MIEEITLVNESLGQSVVLNKTSALALLANDKAIDWGGVPSNISTFSSVNRHGVGINYVAVSSGRDVSITGWLINDSYGTISEKKEFLNTFCDVFSDITIIAGEYKLLGRFKQAIKYSTENKENNSVCCKFIMYLFCENPLFTRVNREESSVYNVHTKSFVFPLIWLTGEPIVFGTQQGLSGFILKNSGTLATGFQAYIKILVRTTGLSITNHTLSSTLRIKSSTVFEPGDLLYINTIIGQRSIKVGTTTEDLVNAFEIFDVDSDFIQLNPGQNQLSVNVESGDLQAEFYIEPLYYAMEDQ